MKDKVCVTNNITGEVYTVHNIIDDLYLIEYRGDKHYVRVDNIIWSVAKVKVSDNE